MGKINHNNITDIKVQPTTWHYSCNHTIMHHLNANRLGRRMSNVTSDLCCTYICIVSICKQSFRLSQLETSNALTTIDNTESTFSLSLFPKRNRSPVLVLIPLEEWSTRMGDASMHDEDNSMKPTNCSNHSVSGTLSPQHVLINIIIAPCAWIELFFIRLVLSKDWERYFGCNIWALFLRISRK